MDESVVAPSVDGGQQWIADLAWTPTAAWHSRRRTADIYMLKRIINKTGEGALTKEQKGLYKAAACDAIWTKERLRNAGYQVDSNLCEKCAAPIPW